jgi:hypothetical protein
VGPGGRKNKHNNPGPQAEEKDNEHHRALKGMQDMKKLQAELKVVQMQKQERQAQMEPLQEKAAEIIVQLEEEKKNMVQAQKQSVQ